MNNKSLDQSVTINEYEDFWKNDLSSKEDEKNFWPGQKIFLDEEKLRMVLKNANLPSLLKIADFGCGTGLSETAFISSLRTLWGGRDV